MNPSHLFVSVLHERLPFNGHTDLIAESILTAPAAQLGLSKASCFFVPSRYTFGTLRLYLWLFRLPDMHKFMNPFNQLLDRPRYISFKDVGVHILSMASMLLFLVEVRQHHRYSRMKMWKEHNALTLYTFYHQAVYSPETQLVPTDKMFSEKHNASLLHYFLQSIFSTYFHFRAH